MSNLIYDPDDAKQVDAVVQWAKANGLRPNWIPATDIFVRRDEIHYREIVPAPGQENAEFPDGVRASDADGDFTEEVTGWQVAPLVAAPSQFGIEVRA